MEAFEPDISTHTPLTGRDSCVSSGVIESLKISTHTPLTGRDFLLFCHLFLCWISTHTPLTGRNIDHGWKHLIHPISTHTPLTGRDASSISLLGYLLYFYSHAPYGT